jgi:hypothetical protein
MDYPPFYRTRRGERFFCKTLPDLIKAIERIADRLPEVRSERQTGIDELLLATYGLANAVDEILDTEIVPGSKATQQAFRNLRSRAKTARQSADVIR